MSALGAPLGDRQELHTRETVGAEGAERPPGNHTETFGRRARQVIANGYQPIPVHSGKKQPAVARWPAAPSRRTRDGWMVRHADCGVGLVGGRIVAVDVDVLDAEGAQCIADLVKKLLGPTPLIRVGRAPKCIFVYRLSEPMPKRRVQLGNGVLELLAEGAFFVAFGIHPETREPYRWIGEGTPIDTPMSDLPVVTPPPIRKSSRSIT